MPEDVPWSNKNMCSVALGQDLVSIRSSFARQCGSADVSVDFLIGVSTDEGSWNSPVMDPVLVPSGLIVYVGVTVCVWGCLYEIPFC